MSLVNKLFESRKVILEMLKDRTMNTDLYDNFTLEEIDALYKTNMKPSKDINSLDIVVSNNKKIIVKYMLSSKIRTQNIMNLLEDILDEETLNENDTIILVIRDKLSNPDQLEQHFENIYSKSKVFVQLFNLDMLMYNVTKHVIVPKHELLNEAEINEVLLKYNLENLNQLPLILKTDPVAKYHGMKISDVFRIIRPSETAGVYTSYRYCQ
jgi:DNA-directed RNA polymerases I, II, and III subunit RPABC1